jgi:hypothetical protein
MKIYENCEKGESVQHHRAFLKCSILNAPLMHVADSFGEWEHHNLHVIKHIA